MSSIFFQYSFVCPLTSLVVVKPNGTNDVDTESAKPGAEDHYGGYPLALSRPAVSKLGKRICFLLNLKRYKILLKSVLTGAGCI